MNIRLLLSMAFAIGGVAILLLWTQPQIKLAREAIMQEEQARDALAFEEQELKRYEELKNELRSKADDIAKAAQSIPAKQELRSDTPELLSLFVSLEGLSGVSIESISFSGERPAAADERRTQTQSSRESLFAKTIDTSIIATQTGFRRLLERSAQSLRLLEPGSFSLAPDKKEPFGPMQLSLNFTAYFVDVISQKIR